MKNQNRLLVYICILLLVFGCSSNNGTVESVISPLFTETAPPASVFSPFPNPIPIQTVTPSCIKMDATASFAVRGVAVFRGTGTLDTVTYLYDLEKKMMISLSSTSFFGVSPDRKKLLYEYDLSSSGNYRLAIIDTHGNIMKDFDEQINNDWWLEVSWHDNESLRIPVFESPPTGILLRVFNPYTHEYRPLKTDWDDLYTGRGLDWGIDHSSFEMGVSEGINIIYDPTLARVVYPKTGEIISLTDVTLGNELASIQLPGWGRLPRWSENGRNLVLLASVKPGKIQGADEFFIVARDGMEFRRLTHLTNIFENVAISDYAWSPDGRRIAFWLNTDPVDAALEGTQSELALLDIETGAVTSLCVQGISAVTFQPLSMVYTAPVWSPDGRQIMFTRWNPQDSQGYDVIIADLANRSAMVIHQNLQPAGWMTKEP